LYAFRRGFIEFKLSSSQASSLDELRRTYTLVQRVGGIVAVVWLAHTRTTEVLLFTD
jgi:hypothetical protein